jgi:hypothetical protein
MMGVKTPQNMLRHSWLPIKSLIVASNWSRLYLITIEACQATNSCCKKYNDDSLEKLKDMF